MIQSAYVFAKQTQCTENSACIRIFCTKPVQCSNLQLLEQVFSRDLSD